MDSENKIKTNDTTDALVDDGDSKSDSATSQSLVVINGDLKSDPSSLVALAIDGDSESDTDDTQGLNNTNRISKSDSSSSKVIEMNDDDSDTDSDATEAINNNNTKEDSKSDSPSTIAFELGENLGKESQPSSSSSSSSSEDCFQLGIAEEGAIDQPKKGPSGPVPGPESEPEQQPPPPLPRVTFQIAGGPPPPQAMEPPAGSGYRIPSYVFARTKSTAPAEWSTASNESLFSIHMGNTSFSKDQLFLQGKSGDLGAPSNPFLDIANTMPSHSIQSSDTNFDGDFRAEAEAKAAETMREVIRELSALDTPVSPREPSAISRNNGESTKSFAFPVLASEGDKSVSIKVGVAPAEQQKQRAGTVNADPADPPKANQIVPQNRLFSIPCFSCCRPSCF